MSAPQPAPAPSAMTIAAIQEHVGAYFGVPVVALIGCRRDELTVWPRHIAMYLARRLTGQSAAKIGRAFGDRDPTTVLYGVRRVEARLAAPHVAQAIGAIARAATRDERALIDERITALIRDMLPALRSQLVAARAPLAAVLERVDRQIAEVDRMIAEAKAEPRS